MRHQAISGGRRERNIADALIERVWPRNLRLPQFRSGHRQTGSNPKVRIADDTAGTMSPWKSHAMMWSDVRGLTVEKFHEIRDDLIGRLFH
jgi:hypothetical protein